ncbi:hypothetical protein [Novosphingobium aquimarinum]|uniref:hypothetical protein n=1 Tax=Novosphingobium aquimarinum TaxID=2682494 RepID=UPI0012EC6D6B|nr:hypothetical protein [Novosphingobium aquimarinum]
MERPVPEIEARGIEHVMRAELARGDAMAGTILPILRHLITNDDNSVFSDEIIARIRGMMTDLATQLTESLSQVSGDRGENGESAPIDAVFHALIDNPLLLGHVHALAIEAQLGARLQTRLSLDPVLPPLLQSLIASPDAGTQALAMQVLAAQARFNQAQRRMRLSLAELPGDEFHAALIAFRSAQGADTKTGEHVVVAERSLRAGYDEGQSRIGLLARLVHSMGEQATSALAVTEAGVSLFVTALGLLGGQRRDTAILATHESQLSRLALLLRSAGLTPSAVEEQFFALHPQVTLPRGFDALDKDEAAAILSSGPLMAT